MPEPKNSFSFPAFCKQFSLTMVSTVGVRVFTFPFNTAIVRYQKDPIPLKNAGEVILGVNYHKGYRAWPGSLYSGFAEKVIQSCTHKSIRILIQPVIEQKLDSYFGPKLDCAGGSYYKILIAGMSGGLIANLLLVTYPFEQIIYAKRSFNYSEVTSWHVPYRDKNLFRGLLVAWPRNILSSAIPFAVVEATKSQEHGELKATIGSSLLNVVFTAPFETVLERMRDKEYAHESAREAARAIAKQGLSHFYRGMTLTLFAKGVKHVLPIIAATKLWEQKTEKAEIPIKSGC